MKKKILTVCAAILVLFSAVSSIALWRTNCALRADVNNLTEELYTQIANYESDQKILDHMDHFVEQILLEVARIETRYQDLNYSLENQSEPVSKESANELPPADVPYDPFQRVTINVSSQEYEVLGDYDTTTELANALSNFSVQEIEKYIFDYGYFVGHTENNEHYILITPLREID